MKCQLCIFPFTLRNWRTKHLILCPYVTVLCNTHGSMPFVFEMSYKRRAERSTLCLWDTGCHHYSHGWPTILSLCPLAFWALHGKNLKCIGLPSKRVRVILQFVKSRRLISSPLLLMPSDWSNGLPRGEGWFTSGAGTKQGKYTMLMEFSKRAVKLIKS